MLEHLQPHDIHLVLDSTNSMEIDTGLQSDKAITEFTWMFVLVWFEVQKQEALNVPLILFNQIHHLVSQI